jgi:hypothetical protein
MKIGGQEEWKEDEKRDQRRPIKKYIYIAG